MFGRPRCREWTPLASQQLRLRSLIQIVGYNIRPPESYTSHCSFYVTLHLTTMSAPFYTTERVTSPHPKWKEIDSEIIPRMASSNVVVRIWCHKSSSPNKDNNTQEKTSDVIIQTWGVYFSGLRYIGANLARNITSDCFKENTLVFQMQGGYFCSYKSLKLDVKTNENEIEYGSLSSDSSTKTSSNNMGVESKIQTQRLKDSIAIAPVKSSRNDIEYSKSHSPIERGFKQSFPSVRASSSLNINKGKGDTNQIYEHLPLPFSKNSSSTIDSISNPSQEDISSSKIDLSETAESYDIKNSSEWLSIRKYRYLALNFLKSEIRPSYNVARLQKLHLLQYSIKKRKEAVYDVKERIYKKSAWTEDRDNDKIKKSRVERNLFDLETDLDASKCSRQSDLGPNNVQAVEQKSVGPRLTLKLNDLLSLKSKPSPHQRSEHVRLTKQLEILRFKRILLADERDRKLVNIRRLKEMYSKLYEENQDVGLELMRNYHALCRRRSSLASRGQRCAALAELCARSHHDLMQARAHLLRQIDLVFPIRQVDEQTWTICDIPLPTSRDCSVAPLAACEPHAAACCARALQLAAAALDVRPRYALRFTPLGALVEDALRDHADHNIPLYPRGGDATLYRYGLFLLNKCIVQLLYSCRLHTRSLDLRTTLPNLRCLLLSTPHNASDSARLFGTYKGSDGVHSRAQSLRSLVASDDGRHSRQFNRFKEVVDGHSPQSMMSLQKHRLSKSVGSSPFDHNGMELNAVAAPTLGSEPNIYNTDPSINVQAEKILKSHNSDSKIDQIRDNTSTNEVFTIADDAIELNIETERLVRLSVHNDIDISCQANIDSGFKDICTEIEDYCTKNDDIDGCVADICECKDVGSSTVSTTGAIDDTSIDIVKYLEKNNDQHVNISNVDKHAINNEDTIIETINCKIASANIQVKEISDLSLDRDREK